MQICMKDSLNKKERKMRAPAEETLERKTTTENENSDNITTALSSLMNSSFIKPSLSMISLPPKEQRDGRDVTHAKLRVERPYNSLKKKRSSDADTWRHSWGSTHSHSSCSLHSNATGGGCGFNIGKDDFWAAIQSNYNYIMDTHLLDTCKEAHYEIEDATSDTRPNNECCQKQCLQSSQREGACEDPKELRKWLRDMENKLSIAPSLSEATQMSIAELQKRLAEHSVLYCAIVSHARVVGACIRASEKENSYMSDNNKFLSPKEESTIPLPNKKRFEGNLKGLERRYHLLYLKAIEVQCMLEGLLGRKNSTGILSRSSSNETDDEPASKLARLSDSETNSTDFCDFITQQTISDKNKSEQDEGAGWEDLDYASKVNTKEFQINADFDADSEGSDVEIRQNKETNRINSCRKDKIIHSHHRLNKFKNNGSRNSIISENMDSNSYQSDGSIEFVSVTTTQDNNTKSKLENTKTNLNHHNLSIKTSKTTITAQNNCVNSIGGNITTITSTSEIKAKKHSRNDIDTSKFNRSNRKSKNCAIFYFKHLDTDTENFGLSSQGSDAFKSSEPSSDDEGWLFSNDCIDGKQQQKNNSFNECDSDKENKEIERRSISNCSLSGSYNNIEDKTSQKQIPASSSDSHMMLLNSTISTMECNRNYINYGLSSLENTYDKEAELLNEEKEHRKMAMVTMTSISINTNTTNVVSGSGYSKEEINNENATSTAAKMIFISNNCCDSNDNNSKNPMEEIKTKSEMSEKTNMESIRQLVLDAENLVRDETLKSNKKHTEIENSSSSIKKREINKPGSNIKRVQEWLEHQPVSPKDRLSVFSTATTDCEASGEYTESDSIARESDTSEGFTDSVATCMQTTGSTSHCASTEIIEGLNELNVVNAGSYPNLNNGVCNSNNNCKVVRRTNRRNCDRPWSVSCLSQLTESKTIKIDKGNSNQDLAKHSVSESALHILSSPDKKKTNSQLSPVKTSDSKNSLRRRKTRRRKFTVRKTDSGILPYELPKMTQTLMKSKAVIEQTDIIHDLTMALEVMSLPKNKKVEEKSTSKMESEEEEQGLIKPNFKVGSYTTAFMTNKSKLGSLAALENYMNEEQGAITPTNGKEYHTGTEDHSSFSEQAWDNYQEKYNSENYSEGFDSDAARKLLEFGDDYRNFLDSQSDCCSSLSAANNFDSFSPPLMDSLKQSESMKMTLRRMSNITSSVDHARRCRALELQYERRRKSSELKRKSQDDVNHPRSPNTSSSTLHPLSPRSSCKNTICGSNGGDPFRKLDFDLNCSSHTLRRASESDNSIRRRKSVDACPNSHRSSKTLEKSFKSIPSTSSSTNDESDDENEMKSLLSQSRNRLENTNALKIRSHLLRPEDYTEIVATCHDNLCCLESFLSGTPGTILSIASIIEVKDLLSSWEKLLAWSENAFGARKLQEEMIKFKKEFNRLGKQTYKFDSEYSIQYTIEELKNEQTQLQTYRTNMLRLNASIHSWLTKQEVKLKKELEALVNEASENHNNINSNNPSNGMSNKNNNNQEKGLQIGTIIQSENEFHKHLKDEVSDMYKAWEDAKARIDNNLEALTTSLIAWRQLEYGLSEFHQVLGKDRGTLQGLEGALYKGQATPSELAHNVKLVAKLLSEKIDYNQQQQQQQVIISSQEQHDPTRIISITQFTASNGSLSDSGISDGGAASDGGLSERERRLGVLRRLAKQLENALAPGSEALKSIAQRMEDAEAELKALQNTCRELIVQTAVSEHKKSQALINNYNSSMEGKSHQKKKISAQSSKRKSRKRSSLPGTLPCAMNNQIHFKSPTKSMYTRQLATDPDAGDPDDPKHNNSWNICNSDDESNQNGCWAWRVAKIALPMQLALLTLFCAACLMEPQCCDSLNNLSISFTPQLRYIRGPPPI